MSSNERDQFVERSISIDDAAAYLESDAGSVEEFERQRQRQREGGEQADGGGDESRSRRARARAAAEAARREAAAAGRRVGRDARRAATEARRRGGAAARRHAEAIRADEFVDKRKKSRNQEIAERAERAATVAPPTDHTLDVLGSASVVTEMARAGMGGTEPRSSVVNPRGNVDERRSEAAIDPGVSSEGVDPTIGAGLLGSGPEDRDKVDGEEHSAGIRDDLLEWDGEDDRDDEPAWFGLLGGDG